MCHNITTLLRYLLPARPSVSGSVIRQKMCYMIFAARGAILVRLYCHNPAFWLADTTLARSHWSTQSRKRWLIGAVDHPASAQSSFLVALKTRALNCEIYLYLPFCYSGLSWRATGWVERSQNCTPAQNVSLGSLSRNLVKASSFVR